MRTPTGTVHRLAPLLAGGLLVAACGSLPRAASAPEEPTRSPALTVLLVRHAEKLGGDDPELSPAGRERAELLAQMLRDGAIERVHSSDTTRTRATAEPFARQQGLEVELYDPRDLPALAAKLTRQGGRHLVVGHSNTTPGLAALLGGEAGPEINEAGEYDRLYLVTVASDGTATTTRLRFGQLYTAGD